MKLFRAIILFLGITLFINGNLSSNEDSLLAKRVSKENPIIPTNDFEDLVNSFDEAVQQGEAEIFYREIKSKENK